MKTARAASSSAWSLDGNAVFSKDEPTMVDASPDLIDAYAQQVLEKHALERGQALPDDSLGPYVASVLRDCSGDLSQFADCEGLIELLQEYCGFTSENEVKDALEEISISVLKNQVPVPETQNSVVGGLYHNVLSSVHAQPQPSFHFDSIVISPDDEEEFPSLSAVKATKTGRKRPTNLISPNRADSLLPPHLLDEDGIEGKSILCSVQEEVITSPVDHDGEDFPALDSKSRGGTRKSHPASDLAAALFRPSRSRQSSIDETAAFATENANVSVPDPFIEPEQYESTASMLLSMNVDLSHEAAYEAAVLAQADIGTAQYVVNAAMTAPPICRHLLQSGCYRSDCQFSHNIASHTCIFWIRGRCGKGETCRFLHGFHETHRPEAVTAYNDGLYYQSDVQAYRGTASSWAAPTQFQESYAISSPPGSFASIAYRGYSSSSSFAAPSGARNIAATLSPPTAVPTIRIPQDLWNPHENRDAAAFYIEDPLQRYYHVMAATYHDESVIDLHFQSLKTFATVLETVLPQRLEMVEQVWIVTGTGHHVGSRTHQKGGGALESAVLQWLLEQGYRVFRGKDKNGQGGALLVKR
ncbi:hypothetical protein FisN_25Lh146 [Fistulifera solaris]|uniref:Smr domain-containing protein n=1 Tax=Fistulifera solaris TaxID=1519565 RepID=A0A1Z5J7U6_FISSO|nr:hypothetical protein FisN_25Lh146 [Fistulifera solaris]|eukprot:GAX10006.1 hypothetical protein FisN_25Lh146 [Fistulifera solaris]